MKTILAALVTVSAVIAPAFASEPTFALRGAEPSPAVQGETATPSTPVPAAEAPARKVRVVLASPYGN